MENQNNNQQHDEIDDLPFYNETEAPRRIRLDLNTPAELAIRNAVKEIEAAGADPKLTQAIILLNQAREMIADFVDNVPDQVEEKELSFGEKIVRTKFNPSNVGNVNFFKDTTAKILNVIDENRDLDPRLAAIAITTFEDACMWSVKLATAKS